MENNAYPETNNAIPTDGRMQKYSSNELRNPITRKEFLADFSNFLMYSGMSSVVAQSGLTLLINSEAARKGAYESSKYEPLPSLTIDGKKFRLIGVRHNPKTFELNELDIEKRVDNAPFVILEYFDGDIRKIALPTVDVKRLPEQQYNDLVDKFYGGIAAICARKGKDIITVNPENALSQEIDLYVLFGVPGALAITDIEYLIKKVRSKPVSRRHFLKLLGYGVAGLTWASWTGLTKQFRERLETTGIISKDLPDEEKANILGWNLIDWRDLKSSQGVMATVKNFGEEVSLNQEIPMFQGKGHNGMLEYLRDHQLAERKDILYAHQNLVGTNSVRRFSFDKNSNNWELISEVKY